MREGYRDRRDKAGAPGKKAARCQTNTNRQRHTKRNKTDEANPLIRQEGKVKTLGDTHALNTKVTDNGQDKGITSESSIPPT